MSSTSVLNKNPIAYLAAMTFALYLTHFPLLELFSPFLSPLPLAVAVLVSVLGLALMTDRLRGIVRVELNPLLVRR